MSEVQAEADTGGFRFAVTLLAALGTILYAVYTYLQTTPVDSFRYFFICGFFSIAVILIFCLLLYILIKGYSIEVDNQERKRKLNKRASVIYLMVFPVCTALLILFLCTCGFAYLDMKYNLATYLSYSVIGLITWGAAFVCVYIIFGDFLGDIELFNKKINQIESRWMKILMKFSIILCIFGILYVIWLAMFSIIITSTSP